MSSESKASVFVGEALHRSVHSTARNTQRARARHKADRPDTPHPGPAGPRLALRALKLQHDPRLINGAILSAPPKCPVAGQNKATPKLEYVAAPLPPDGLRKPITRDSVSHKVSALSGWTALHNATKQVHRSQQRAPKSFRLLDTTAFRPEVLLRGLGLGCTRQGSNPSIGATVDFSSPFPPTLFRPCIPWTCERMNTGLPQATLMYTSVLNSRPPSCGTRVWSVRQSQLASCPEFHPHATT